MNKRPLGEIRESPEVRTDRSCETPIFLGGSMGWLFNRDPYNGLL